MFNQLYQFDMPKNDEKSLKKPLF